MGDTCDYGDLSKVSYDMAMAGMSEVLFEHDQICRFKLRCMEDVWWCIPDTSIIVTAMSL
ncbi:RlpA-like domain superfamily [Sesbania bispinosa]|nr:RlpA-like domain superfamily [Sesbania bispinosa]